MSLLRRLLRGLLIFVLLLVSLVTTAYHISEPGSQALLGMASGASLAAAVMLLESDWGKK